MQVAVLIAPLWPSQLWYPVLLELTSDDLEYRLTEPKRAAKLSEVTEKIVNLVKHLLVPLFGPVDLEKGYRSLVEQVGMLGPDGAITDLGVGSQTPPARSKPNHQPLWRPSSTAGTGMTQLSGMEHIRRSLET